SARVDLLRWTNWEALLLPRLNWQARRETEMNGKPGTPNSTANGPVTAAANALGILRKFAYKSLPAERCELCSAALPPDHPHLVELSARRLLCSCPACALLFDGNARRRYKRVPRRVQLLEAFRMTDSQWDGLLVPINMAFFFFSSVEGR